MFSTSTAILVTAIKQGNRNRKKYYSLSRNYEIFCKYKESFYCLLLLMTNQRAAFRNLIPNPTILASRLGLGLGLQINLWICGFSEGLALRGSETES